MKTITIFNKIKLFFIRLKPSNLIYEIVKPLINKLEKKAFEGDLIIVKQLRGLENKINKLEKRLGDEINATNNAFEDVARDIIKVEEKLDKSIDNIKLDITELRRIIENNDKRIDLIKEQFKMEEGLSEGNCSSWLSDDTKRNIKLNALQTPFNDDDECGVCDEFIKINAEQQTELDKLKEDNKQLNNNDIRRVDVPNMIAEIMTATLTYEQDMNMKDDERKRLMINLRCIISNNINLSNEKE